MIGLTYDLHIHSCLSPCGDNDMTPGNIVGMARLKELEVIAVTDHNTCRNCPAVMKFAKEYGIIAIPGMELTTREEVHVLCLFPTLEKALEYDTYVYEHLQKVTNNPVIFGEQRLMDAQDECIATEPNLLMNATDIPFDRVYELVGKYDGVMIPAHIEKGTNSLIANLGFIGIENQFGCVELKDLTKLHSLQQQHPYLMHCKTITDSDAHYLEHIHEAEHTIYSESREITDILNALR